MTIANQTIIAEGRTLANELLISEGNIETSYFPKWGRMAMRLIPWLPTSPCIGISIPLYLSMSAGLACFGDYWLDSHIEEDSKIKLAELNLGKFIDVKSTDTIKAVFSKIYQQKTYEEVSKHFFVTSRVKAVAALGFALATWANVNRLDSDWHDYSTGTRDLCCLTAGLAIAISGIFYNIYLEMTERAQLAKNIKEKAKLFTLIDETPMPIASNSSTPNEATEPKA